MFSHLRFPPCQPPHLLPLPNSRFTIPITNNKLILPINWGPQTWLLQGSFLNRSLYRSLRRNLNINIKQANPRKESTQTQHTPQQARPWSR